MSGLRYTALYAVGGPPVVNLAGDGALALSGEGQLQQDHALRGDGVLVLSGVGTLDVGRSELNLAGDGVLALSGSGALEVVIHLAGDGMLALSGTGSLVRGVTLRGDGALALSGAGQLVQDHALAGDGHLVLSGSDGYTGPGTGLDTGTPDEAAWLASLREGDTFRIVIPSGIPFGRTALARVLGRAIDAQGRLSLTLQLDDWPTASRLVIQDTVTVARYQPEEALDLARRTVEAGRAIERLERERD